MSAATATRGRALHLYREFLRVGRSFNDYNVREYVKRRAGERFRENRGLTDAEAVRETLAAGEKELEKARRQATIYALYGDVRRPNTIEV